MAKKIVCESIPEASKPSDQYLATGNLQLGLLGHSPVDWGKVSAYLAMFAILGGAMWQFADVFISVKNLRDDMKELQRKSENLLLTSVETSVRVTALERGDAQQPHGNPSSCPTKLPQRGQVLH